jgi:uncharacterized membrane protein (TIGR02234 family)
VNVRREYTLALLTGAVGAGLIWLALREQWAQAVFIQPKPLPRQTVGVTGTDLVPLAGGLAIAALACLAAIIATRGVWRRGAGVLLAAFGAGAGAVATASVTAASVVSVAAGNVASPESAVVSGTAGSTTSGGSSPGGAFVVAGSAGHAVMSGASWRYAVIAGALLIVAAGLLTLMRGADWPVMSSRYELPRRRSAASGGAGTDAAPGPDTAPAGPRDSASMWETLSGGDDPTAGPAADEAEAGAGRAGKARPRD